MTDHLVGIVVLVHNRADVATLCLESLAAAATSVPFRVYVLDNGSRPDQAAAVENVFQRLQADGRLPGSFRRSIRNLGFPAGNNAVIEQLLAQEDCTHVCLLNSDVVVTDHWLDHLLAHDADVIGPVTNACGNEQTVPVDELPAIGPAAITAANAIAADRYRRFRGFRADTAFLGFFCCLLRLEVLVGAGLLDERFGRGAFEDDDYCLRMRNRGFRLQIARDVFVLHWGSASFSQLGMVTLMRQLRRGRRRFERKHGIEWQSRWLLPIRGAFDDLGWLSRESRSAAAGWQFAAEPPRSRLEQWRTLCRLQWRRWCESPPMRLLRGLCRLPFVVLTRRPVLVLGRRHPPVETPKDGYFQRVRLIDQQLEDRHRIYLCFEQPERAGRFVPGIVQHGLRSFELFCRPHNIAHGLLLLVTALLAGRIYVHSVLRLGDGIAPWLYRLARRRVLDLHGAVPEEFASQGDPHHARTFDDLERLAVTRATALVVVSRAMQRHLEHKHGRLHAPVHCLPMMPRPGSRPSPAVSPPPRAGVVYCGGLHPWQRLDDMLDYVHRMAGAMPFTFLVTEPAQVLARYREKFAAEFPGTVTAVPPDEVDAVESRAAFGLLLRSDHVLNRVACPTKLVEYLHNGLVPILDSADLGDFAALGLAHVPAAAALPDEPQRARMVRSNQRVLRHLQREFVLAAAALRRSL